MKSLSFTIMLCAIVCFCYAQKEANIWYFGQNAGLDFNSGKPVALTNGALNTAEGCSSICDSTGALLFYTDGVTIWNRNHTAMPNGQYLAGSFTSTQSALIVKQPGNKNIYYVFCNYTAFQVLVVDMTKDGGLGDVTQNFFILSGSEKICATKAFNGKDVWIVMHERATNAFNAFLLNSTSFNIIPVVSKTGLVDSTTLGQMKLSPQGDKIAFGVFGTPQICVSHFDNKTGTVSASYSITFPNNYLQCYGIEFSPDGNKLYASAQLGPVQGNVYQFNLKAGNPGAVAASGTVVGNAQTVSGGLQLGPDGKLYISPNGETFLDAINNPDALGTACNYVHNAVSLNGRSAEFGLPEYVSNILAPTFGYIKSCFNDTTFFYISDTSNLTSVAWNFGDLPSGSRNTSSLFNPGHIYSTSGNFNVTLIRNYKTRVPDTSSLTASILPGAVAGIVTTSRDSICADAGISSLVSVTGNSDTIIWQSSLNGTTFTDLPIDSTSFKTPKTMSQTTSYRVVAISSLCGLDTSNAVTIKIVGAPVGTFAYTINGNDVTFNSSGSSGVTTYSWDFGDGTTNALPNPVHHYLTKDTFYVCLSVYNGSNCSFTDCKYVDVQDAGIIQPNSEPAINIFPNPFSEQLIINSEYLKGSAIDLTDILGRTLFVQTATNNKAMLNTGMLTSGIYFIHVHFANHDVIRKLVKE